MPISSLTAAVAGDPMQWSGVESNLDTIRDWINGGVQTSDIVAGSLRREHIVRPRIEGAPVNGFIGQLHALYGVHDMQSSAKANSAPEWASRRARDSIKPYFVPPGDTWRTRLGVSFYLPKTAVIFVKVQASVFVNGNASLNYPNGSGSGSRLGRLSISNLARVNLQETEYEHSRHYLFPEVREAAYMASRMSLLAGWHDVFLVYERGTIADISADVQIDIARFNMHITAHY